jgi:hypothetical protein
MLPNSRTGKVITTRFSSPRVRVAGSFQSDYWCFIRSNCFDSHCPCRQRSISAAVPRQHTQLCNAAICSEKRRGSEIDGYGALASRNIMDRSFPTDWTCHAPGVETTTGHRSVGKPAQHLTSNLPGTGRELEPGYLVVSAIRNGHVMEGNFLLTKGRGF